MVAVCLQDRYGILRDSLPLVIGDDELEVKLLTAVESHVHAVPEGVYLVACNAAKLIRDSKRAVEGLMLEIHDTQYEHATMKTQLAALKQSNHNLKHMWADLKRKHGRLMHVVSDAHVHDEPDQRVTRSKRKRM